LIGVETRTGNDDLRKKLTSIGLVHAAEISVSSVLLKCPTVVISLSLLNLSVIL